MAASKISLKVMQGLLIAASGAGMALAAPAGPVATHTLRPAQTVYPLTVVDSLVWLEQPVLASDTAKDGFLGWSLALDGTTALIGSPQCGCIGAAGKAYIFTKSDGTWTQIQMLTSSDGVSDDQFGWSVALDGSTAVLGAELADVNGNKDQGAAYVFVESDGHWSQVAKLSANDGAAGDQFGWAVALDGSTILVGAESADVNGNADQGAVYVFTGAGGNWTQSAKLTASAGAANADFGHAIALSGTTALIGADDAGAAYVFTGAGSNWSEAAKLVPNDPTGNDGFGSAVALSGTSALIGAERSGAAYVFTGSGSGWNQSAELTPSGVTANGGFGAAVALDGTSALIGANDAEMAGNAAQGTAYLFTETNGIWSQTQKFIASNGSVDDQYGFAVALGDGTALVGAPQANPDQMARQGELYVHSKGNLGLTVSAPATAEQGATYVSQTIVTNNAGTATPPLAVTISVPASVQFVSVTSTPAESCNRESSRVICNFGSIEGNAGTATANITFKANAERGTVLENTAAVIGAQPALSASAATTVADNPPVAKDGTLNTAENAAASGTLEASDVDGDPLTFAIVATPAHGTVKIDDASAGNYTYTPADGYSGSDSFTFKANDGSDDSNIATIGITVKAQSTGGNPGGSGTGTGGGGNLDWFTLVMLLGLAIGAFGLERLKFRRGKAAR